MYQGEDRDKYSDLIILLQMWFLNVLIRILVPGLLLNIATVNEKFSRTNDRIEFLLDTNVTFSVDLQYLNRATLAATYTIS